MERNDPIISEGEKTCMTDGEWEEVMAGERALLSGGLRRRGPLWESEEGDGPVVRIIWGMTRQEPGISLLPVLCPLASVLTARLTHPGRDSVPEEPRGNAPKGNDYAMWEMRPRNRKGPRL